MNKEPCLFVSDLDGTLLTSNKQISPLTYQALLDYAGAGNYFAICTGRDNVSALMTAGLLGLDFPGTFVASYNGSHIYDIQRGETVYRCGIPLDVVTEIFRLAGDIGVHVHTYDDSFILTKTYDEETAYYRRVIKTPLRLIDDPPSGLVLPAGKILCVALSDHERQEVLKKEVMRRFGHLVTTMYSCPEYLEIIPKESGKGRALIRLADHLGIPIDHTAAAGDAENDLPMLEAAGTGVAMKNGDGRVKAAAGMVTEADNDHDGLANVLEMLAGGFTKNQKGGMIETD